MESFVVRILLLACCWSAVDPSRAQVANQRTPAAAETQAALDSIRSEELLKHIRVLASDEFEGRAPGTHGEELTVNYLIEQCKRLGLKPGNPDGTYIQNVPMVGFTPQPSFSYRVGNQTTEVAFPAECVVWSPWFVPEVDVVDSEMIFVGYGVVAPEYGWDDFKDVDVRGKTIVMLINDPAIPDPNDPGKLDDKMFRGRAMTYYGRWTYKYEIAAAKGAAAAIIVHETGPAGYPYFVLVSSNSRENFDLQSPNKNRDRASVESWITLDQAKKFFAAAGHDFDSLKQSAIRRDFRPVPLASKATFRIKTALREVASRNVAALLEGSDAKLKNELVIYTAHWDHLGKNPKMDGDQIFNGALDNASGTAGLIELAEAFTKLRPAPRRSTLFLFVTAEEKGLLGAKYYATHPLYPLTKTLANLNMDVINPWGRTRDINVIGYGSTTLEDVLQDFARAQGRVVTPDSEPEKGRFYRSDHFEFAKLGVPALYLKAGVEFIGKPAGYGQQKSDEYTTRDYHKPSDEVKPDWDLSGAVEDLRVLFNVGYRVAQGDTYPEWKPGTEFKARREDMLRERQR
ncbi:MAG: M28 family peptidase [Verrucomicrobia bacterium]|nr:M28 family peptidase [Verrucomicrobiota bacterium]